MLYAQYDASATATAVRDIGTKGYFVASSPITAETVKHICHLSSVICHLSSINNAIVSLPRCVGLVSKYLVCAFASFGLLCMTFHFSGKE